MKTILMILILTLSLPLFSTEKVENEIKEPTHSVYQVKVFKTSNSTLEFEELEDLQFFMIRNDLYEVWLKSPSSTKWRRYWRPKRCSCEIHQSI